MTTKEAWQGIGEIVLHTIQLIGELVLTIACVIATIIPVALYVIVWIIGVIILLMGLPQVYNKSKQLFQKILEFIWGWTD